MFERSERPSERIRERERKLIEQMNINENGVIINLLRLPTLGLAKINLANELNSNMQPIT